MFQKTRMTHIVFYVGWPNAWAASYLRGWRRMVSVRKKNRPEPEAWRCGDSPGRSKALAWCKARRLVQPSCGGVSGEECSTEWLEAVAEGIPSPGGKEVWSSSTVKSILTNERVQGDITCIISKK